jgi:ubiquinone/menaquinone biosynthesis C-methylase UbiE
MLGNPKPIEEIRQRIIPLARGNVLEIGVGPGVNFVHYDPVRVEKVYALEPNPGMLRRAKEQRRRTELEIEFIDLTAKRIPGGRPFMHLVFYAVVYQYMSRDTSIESWLVRSRLTNGSSVQGMVAP